MNRGARAGAHQHAVYLASATDDAAEVRADLGPSRDSAYRLPGLEQVPARYAPATGRGVTRRWAENVQRMAQAGTSLVQAQDAVLFRRRRMCHFELQQEAIKLCLGQPVGALVLDGILRRHHRK